MKKPVAYIFVMIVFLFVVSGTAIGWQQDYKLLDMDTYMEMESVGSPSISPDGKLILFTRGGVDKMNDRRMSNLLMMDIEGERIRELTFGNFRVSSPRWSPDGKRIAFLSDRSGTDQIHVMWLDTREVVQLTNFERSPGSPLWSPDGKMLAFTSFIPDTKQVLTVKPPKFPEGAKKGAPAVVEDRLAWRRDGRGYNKKGYTHIFVIDAKLGGTPRQITSGDYSHSGPEWAPDGEKIYFSAIRKPEVEYQRGNSEIYSVDLKTREIKTLTDRKGPDRGPNVSPDGRWIAYTGYDENDNYSNLSNLYLMDNSGERKRLCRRPCKFTLEHHLGAGWLRAILSPG